MIWNNKIFVDCFFFFFSDRSINITERLTLKLPLTNMILNNKTLILVARNRGISSTQQLALLAGMAFIGGIVAGLLIRFIYYGIVKYFTSNMGQISNASQGSTRGNVNSSFVGDSFSLANDEPPDYVTVVTQTTNCVPQQQLLSNIKPGEGRKNSKIIAESPPSYISIVSNFARVIRSASR